MGLIGQMMGARRGARAASDAVGGLAEVFVGNRAEREAGDYARTQAALEQYGAEFKVPAQSRFDRFMDGLNRLPRPLLVIGTLGLFAYAMVEPAGFSRRMEGLGLVPGPLWWLLGAIVSFYFGARELHYQRGGAMTLPRILKREGGTVTVPGETAADDEPAALFEMPAVQDDPPASAAQKAEAPLEPVRFSGRSGAAPVEVRASDPTFNAALEEWRRSQA